MQNTKQIFGSIFVLLVVCAFCSWSPAQPATGQAAGTGQGKIPITRLADLPPHVYAIPKKPSLLVEDRAAVLELAKAIEADVKADMEKYDIQDQTAVRRFYGMLVNIAMLKRDFASARIDLEKVRELQDKPVQKMTSGVMSRALIDALETSGGDFHGTYRANLAKGFSALPYQETQDYFKGLKASAEIMSKNLLLGGMASSLDPAAESGKLSQELASGILSGAATLQDILPNKEDVLVSVNAVLDANSTAKKADIWQAREVTLDGAQNTTPVIVGIWDSGVDLSIFKNQVFTNTKEIPGNQKDDDGNGFVDDVHGIAWTLHSDYSTDLLYPIRSVVNDPDADKAVLKGFTDLQANIDSPEATALKQKLAGLAPEKIKPFMEETSAYGNYSHGTHVAGIAVRGNPAARILVCRITFDYHMIAEKPTIEQAEKDAAAMVKSVDYFKQNKVRVVNMSWGGDLRSVENDLEMNNAGGTAEERRALARKIFDIQNKALFDAIKSAPEVLFVVAAGNANNDVKFDEVYPSSFKAPNVLVAGAVDQAGEQTSFTSFGNVDVYSSGFEVESYIPGGDKMKLSGTSMAAPNVTNLAGKLWALHPTLSVAEVKKLIVQSADEQKSGDKTIRLLNPKKTIATAAAGSN